MYAVLYLMLHGIIWFSLSRYQSRLVTQWSAAGMVSAIGLALLGAQGFLPEWLVAGLGQTLMAVGNFSRQHVLRSTDGPVGRHWIAWNGSLHLAYLILNGYLFVSGASHWSMMLVFFVFYALICVDFVFSGRAIGQRRQTSGAMTIQFGGLVFSVSLAIKALTLLAGWGAQGLYDPGWDQAVLFACQILAISLLNFGFVQMLMDQFQQERAQVEQALVQQRQQATQAQLKSIDLATLLREREEIIRQLTLSNKSAGMGALVASFAHELNQPLAATLLHAELVQGQMKAALDSGRPVDPQLIGTVASHIVSDTERAGDIIRKLRKLFRMGKGEFAKLDFKELVLDVLDIVQVKTSEHHVRVLTSFDEPFQLSGDATQLYQVVLNLVNNAIDAMALVEHRQRVLQIRGLVLPGYLDLEIEDNGAGMALDQQAEVFSLFKSPNAQGMGVGLWLSQSIVQSHGGTLSFASQLGQGTVFTLRLPSTDYVLTS